MNDNASLQNLNDIVMPAPAPWWPLAPAWYVLAVVAAVALLWLAFRSWRCWQTDRYRRQALAELSAMRPGVPDTLQALPALLKRTALSAWPRETVAAMNGEDWHRFLDESAGISRFTAGAGEMLDRLSYGTGADAVLSPAEQQQLLQAAESWLKSHRRQAGAGS